MELIEVTDRQLARTFLEVSVVVNHNDPNYVQPLDKDIDEIFDPAKNRALRHSEITRWILKDKNGLLIGRVAAFVNKRYRNKGDDLKVGGLGFFDCIDNQQAAEMLFDVARHWLTQKGMEAMDGPINCGERDRWWGLLVEGFEPPSYCMNYNPAYYQQLWENYGFQTFFNQVCFAMKVRQPLSEKFYKRHEAVSRIPGISARHIDKSNMLKYAEDFTTVYNKAWAGHGGMKQLKVDNVVGMFKKMKPVMDEKLIWFAYLNEEPIGLWVSLPDLNQWFKYLHGQFGFMSRLKFLWIKATKKCTKFTGLAFGVVPDWQATGIDNYMIVEGAKVIQGNPTYEDYEMQWIGDFNPKMINVAVSLGTHRSRKLITYRYLFDRTREFKPHPRF